MEKEEKISDGIYLTRAKKEPVKQPVSNNLNSKYVFKTTSELIAILENDFENIEKEIKMLFDANEEMLKFDPKDYDLIEARQENLVVINKRLIDLKNIQDHLKTVCPTNPLAKIDIFDYFLPKKEEEILPNNARDYNSTQQNVITEIDL